MSLGQGSKQRFLKQKPGDPFSLYRLVSWNSHNFSIKLHGGECKSYRSPLKLIGSFWSLLQLAKAETTPLNRACWTLLETTYNFHPKELIQCLQGFLLSVKDVLRQLGSWDPKKQARKTASQLQTETPWKSMGGIIHCIQATFKSCQTKLSELFLQIRLWRWGLWRRHGKYQLVYRHGIIWKAVTLFDWCWESMHSGPYACLRGFQWVRRFVGCLLAANDPLTEC